jgi:hypothetical protein
VETYTPIELLKNKLTQLKLIPEIEPNLILEYEKAILVLELIGVKTFDDKVYKPNDMNILDANLNNESKKEPKSYYERFMEGQKNKK